MKSTLWIPVSMWVLAVVCMVRAPATPGAPAGDAAGVMDLETAQRIALEGNPTLGTAAARIRQAEARLGQVNATFWPTVGVGASVSRQSMPERIEREIVEAKSTFGDDFEDRIRAELDDGIREVERADRRARDAVRADQIARLRRYPELSRLQASAFKEADRQRALYVNTVRGQLADFDPVSSAIDALGVDTDPTVDNPVTTFGAGIQASWLLFDGFARRFGRAVARYGQVESEEARRDAQRLLLGAVARAYYQAQLAREDMAIAQADLEFNSRLLEEARRRRQAGQVSQSTELNFEVRRNAAESAMVGARREYEGSVVVLAALLGYPDAEMPVGVELAPLPEEQPEQMQPPEPDALLAYALAHRPDVEFARAALEQSEYGIRLARSAYSPTLHLSGGYGGAHQDDPSFEEEDFGGQVGVVLRMDLFEGGQRRAQVREAMAARDEAESGLDQVRLTAASEVRGAALALQYAGELLQLQRRNLSIIERTRDIVELEYNANHASLVRLNEAQRDLVLARGRYAAALASLHVAWQELLQATAQSLEAFNL